MHKKLNIYCLTIILFTFFQFNSINSAEPEWDVEILDNPAPGYLYLGWKSDSIFHLIDNYGLYPFSHAVNHTLQPFKLLSNGKWIAFGQDYVYLLNLEFNIVDSIPNPANNFIDIHDAMLLSNGHYLLICHESRFMDLSVIVEGGKTNARVVGQVLIETDTGGNIYWEWKTLDHFNVTDATHNIDLTQQAIDLTHINSLFEDFDGNILISVRHFDEITKINKSTGDIIWRFGGKFCKNNQFRFLNDTIDGHFGFSHQHSVSRSANGNILLFDNGNLKSPQYSRAVEYQIDENAKTAKRVWQYRHTPDIYIATMGSARRLENGNTLIYFTSLFNNFKIIEIKPDNSVAFKLNFLGEKNQTFLNATRYITKMNAVSQNATAKSIYSFNDSKFQTGIELDINSINGSGLISVEKHNYAPPTGTYSDSNFTSILPFRWVVSKQNLNSFGGNFIINAESVAGLTKPDKAAIYMRAKESVGNLVPINSVYNSSTKKISVAINGTGEFVIVSCELAKPQLIFPVNNQTKIQLSNTLRWNNLIGASTYRLQLSDVSDFSKSITDTILTSNIRSYSFNNLKFSTTYFWRVSGSNSKDTSVWSETFIFNTLDDKIYEPDLIEPIDLSITFSYLDTLLWHKVPQANRYVVQVSDDLQFNSSNQFTYNSSTNFIIPNQLQHFTKYFWRVKSFNDVEESGWSEIWSFETDIDKPVPMQPANLSSNISNGDTLIWKIVDGAKHYRIQLSKLIDFSDLRIDETTNSNDYILTDLEFGETYFWRINAIRDNDISEWSEIFSFNSILKSPLLIRPVHNKKGVEIDSYIEWSSGYTNVLYHLQISDQQDFSNLILDTVNITSKSIKIDELEFNTRYYWRIKLNQDNIESEWSEIRSFLTEMDKPVLVSPLNFKIDVPTQLNEFLWSDLNNYNTYRFQLTTDSLFEDIKLDQNYTTTNIKINLTEDTRYFWRVKSENLNNFGRWSDVFQFNTQPITHVDHNLIISNFYVHPNPAREFITISLPELNKGLQPLVQNVQIFNTLGLDVAQTPSSVINGNVGSNSTQTGASDVLKIDVSHLPTGVYFIKIGDKIEKFVKM